MMVVGKKDPWLRQDGLSFSRNSETRTMQLYAPCFRLRFRIRFEGVIITRLLTPAT